MVFAMHSPLAIQIPIPSLSGSAERRAHRGRDHLAELRRILFRIFDLLPQEPIAPGSADRVREPDHLAAGLQRFLPAQERTFRTKRAVDPPRILFPPSGAQLELTNESGARTPLDLQVAGGTPPYRWFINGQPLPPAPPGGSASWMPDGPGLVHITVSDQNNGNAVSEAWIK
jgi:penicillin-binding protein 1C